MGVEISDNLHRDCPGKVEAPATLTTSGQFGSTGRPVIINCGQIGGCAISNFGKVIRAADSVGVPKDQMAFHFPETHFEQVDGNPNIFRCIAADRYLDISTGKEVTFDYRSPK